MTKAGSRRVKNRFGSYLARAKKGEVILITNRGKPVARLGPVHGTDDSRPTLDQILKRLAAQGHLRLATGRRVRPFKPIRVKGKPASQMIIEDRR